MYLITGFPKNSGGLDKEFVFAIPRIYPDSSSVIISTDSQQLVYTTLSVPGHSIMISRTISRHHGANIALPEDIRMDPGDGKQNKTVIVRASDIVSVYVLTDENCCEDAFQSIPSSQLGTQYRVASYQPVPAYVSFVCISAPHTASVNISIPSRPLRNILLKQYESFRLDEAGLEDGAFVQSDKPVAVIAGCVSSIPHGYTYADGLVSQMLPMKSWGKRYHIFPIKSLNSGFVYRVFPSNISTTLHLSNGSVEYIQPGDFYEGIATGNEAVVSLETDTDVMVVEYLKSFDASYPPRGDPSMVIVPPVTTYTNHVTFPVFRYISSYESHTYYINVVIQCKDMIGLVLDDGRSLDLSDTLTSADGTMCCIRQTVSTGNHSVTHSNSTARFSVSVYAIGNGSSYAYTVRGASTRATGK